MRILALVLSLCLLAAPASALTVDQAHRTAMSEAPRAEFRIAHDSWALTDDKAAHFGLGFAAATLSAWVLSDDTPSERRGILAYNAAFWFVWEVKDALLPWEKAGAIGGDGFSYKDFVYSVAGATLAMAIR